MNKSVRYGLPGLCAAFTLASGVTGFWCRSGDVFGMVLFLLVVMAGASVAAVVFND